MNEPTLKLHVPIARPAALFAALAIIAVALALPGAARAQDPSVDQYAPTAPTADGPEQPTPAPTSDDGGVGGGIGGADDTDGTSSGGGETSAPVDSTSTAPTGSNPSSSADPASSASGTEGNNKDRQTLDGFAANATQQREAAGQSSSDTPATELLRSDSGDDLGLGLLLWVVLGVTALWAIATIVRRRQDQDGHPA